MSVWKCGAWLQRASQAEIREFSWTAVSRACAAVTLASER